MQGKYLRKARMALALVMSFLGLTWLLKRIIRCFPKLLTHEHLDCSVRPLTLLEFWSKIGFDKAKTVPFPKTVVDGWNAAGFSQAKRGVVARLYQRYISKFAQASLKNYVECIVWTVLPVMQTKEALYRITRERIEDAVADGVIAMELRFAPQLHTAGGLSLDEVMESVIAAVREAPIHVSLIVCALRHENADMARQLADLCVRHRAYVGKFDLAGDEHGNPGVLRWWLEEAKRIRQYGIEPTIHLWETDEPTAEDLALLEEGGINVLGHGCRGQLQGDRICTMCMTSNAVTGQVGSVAEHMIDDRFLDGVRSTIDTDGTLFTSTDATNEYYLLFRHRGWWTLEFLVCNLTALEQMPFRRPGDKKKVRSRLIRAYALGD